MPSITPVQDRPAKTPPRAMTVDQARIAWVTAGRDSELDRWRDLYELAVPRPREEAPQS